MSYGSCSFWFQGLDFVVDAGVRVADPSTVVDMTGSFPRIIRQGKVIESTHIVSLNAWFNVLVLMRFTVRCCMNLPLSLKRRHHM